MYNSTYFGYILWIYHVLIATLSCVENFFVLIRYSSSRRLRQPVDARLLKVSYMNENLIPYFWGSVVLRPRSLFYSDLVCPCESGFVMLGFTSLAD